MNARIIYLTICILVLLINTISYSQENKEETVNGLKLVVSTDKSIYLEGEVIWEEILLIIDKSAVKLDYKPHFAPGNAIEDRVINSKNHSVPKHDIIYSYIGIVTDYPDTIRYFEPMCVGKEEEVPNAMYFMCYYLPAEEYELYASVNVSIGGKPYKVKSEPVKFTVLKPEGEEALARQTYLEMLSLFINSNSDTRELAEKTHNFLKQYPNSSYIDQMLRISEPSYLFYYSKTLDEKISFLSNIINKYPDFASNKERLGSIMVYFEEKKDVEGYKNFIKELKSKHKDNSILNKVLYYHNIDFERELRNNEFNKDK